MGWELTFRKVISTAASGVDVPAVVVILEAEIQADTSAACSAS